VKLTEQGQQVLRAEKALSGIKSKRLTYRLSADQAKVSA
jgi:hypothetical protein